MHLRSRPAGPLSDARTKRVRTRGAEEAEALSDYDGDTDAFFFEEPKQAAIICDLDGTLASMGHRHELIVDNCRDCLPKDDFYRQATPKKNCATCGGSGIDPVLAKRRKANWEEFFDRAALDAPVPDVLNILKNAHGDGHRIIFATARPDIYRYQTEDWIRTRLPWLDDFDLHMKKTTAHRGCGGAGCDECERGFIPDKRADALVKEEMYRQDIEPTYDVRLAIDDHPTVIAKWRELGLVTLACFDPDIPPQTSGEEFEKTAAWTDVRNKARRIRRSGGVEIIRLDDDIIVAKVKGDHATYEVEIYRQYPNSKSVTFFTCPCLWGQWSFKRQKTYVGRFCSHALATLYEAHSQERRKKVANAKRGLDINTIETIRSRHRQCPTCGDIQPNNYSPFDLHLAQCQEISKDIENQLGHKTESGFYIGPEVHNALNNLRQPEVDCDDEDCSCNTDSWSDTMSMLSYMTSKNDFLKGDTPYPLKHGWGNNTSACADCPDEECAYCRDDGFDLVDSDSSSEDWCEECDTRAYARKAKDQIASWGIDYAHTWNRLDDGTIIDATADQFGDKDSVRVIPADDPRQGWYQAYDYDRQQNIGYRPLFGKHIWNIEHGIGPVKNRCTTSKQAKRGKGYVYHITSGENRDSIRSKGLLKGQWAGSSWPDAWYKEYLAPDARYPMSWRGQGLTGPVDSSSVDVWEINLRAAERDEDGAVKFPIDPRHLRLMRTYTKGGDNAKEHETEVEPRPWEVRTASDWNDWMDDRNRRYQDWGVWSPQEKKEYDFDPLVDERVRRTLDKMSDEYPITKGWLQEPRYESIDLQGKGGAFGCIVGSGHIVFNKDELFNPKSRLHDEAPAYQQAKPWSIGHGIEQLTAHEFAHALHMAITKDALGELPHWDFDNMLDDSYLPIVRPFVNHEDNPVKQITDAAKENHPNAFVSTYAQRDELENFAEAMLDYWTSLEPEPYSKEIGSRIDALYHRSAKKTAAMTRKVVINGKRGPVFLDVEVADDPMAIQKGLMYRSFLPMNQGMLFDFKRPTTTGFWMQNVSIPLSIAFVDNMNRIIDIQDMDLCWAGMCPSYTPSKPFVMAIEVNQGWFTFNGVGVGDFVNLN